ncbi:MAG: hypothetical protein RUMPE_00041 [Eubacteriales bacterium SKADARSKE-1]|nr:hypothetical protein [Eubacteriales bacterium SKADARSKE-1]
MSKISKEDMKAASGGLKVLISAGWRSDLPSVVWKLKTPVQGPAAVDGILINKSTYEDLKSQGRIAELVTVRGLMQCPKGIPTVE